MISLSSVQANKHESVGAVSISPQNWNLTGISRVYPIKNLGQHHLAKMCTSTKGATWYLTQNWIQPGLRFSIIQQLLCCQGRSQFPQLD